MACVMVGLLASVACASGSATVPENAQVTVLKKWALARCLARAGGDSPAGDDAAKTAAAYLEAGTAEIDVYEKLEALTGSFLDRQYTGSVKSDYNTMKCLDLYESEELDKLATDSTK